jgi:uncharacterized protein (TIGR03437 family)
MSLDELSKMVGIRELTILVGVIASSAVPTLAGDVTISFDDLPASTVVTNQYHSKGVDFSRSSYFDAGLPFISAVPAGSAHSGTQVLDIRNCSGEFCPSAVFGKFTVTRRQVSVYVGNLGTQDESVTLFAYDAGGTVSASVDATLKAGAAVNTLLAIPVRPTADIDSFEVRGKSFSAHLAIDDLSFDVPAVPPGPDFSLRLLPPPGDAIGVRPGGTASITVLINRINGSSGGITFNATGFPVGVVAAFTPNPASGDRVTLNVTARTYADIVKGLPISVTATPASPSAGPATRTITIPLTVAANFAVGDTRMDVAPCTPTSGKILIYTPGLLGSPDPGVIPSDFSDRINLDVQGSVPSGMTVTFSPRSFMYSAGTGTPVTVTVTNTAGSMTDDLTFTVRAISGPYTATGTLSLRRIAGTAESFTPTVGDTPRALKPGTDITIHGTGFCPLINTIKVRFNSDDAVAYATSASADAREIHVNVPRLAIDGPLTITTFAGSFSTKDSFVARTFRGTNGFAFHNYPLSLIFDDYTEAFGKDQTYVTFTVDPCCPIELPFIGCPFGSCPIVKVSPVINPLAYVFYLATNGNVDGHCFGMSLASERLSKGETPFSYFDPPGASTVWQLADKDKPWPALDHHLRIQSLTQFDAGVLHHYIANAANIFASSDTFRSEVPDIRNAIRADLLAGNYPLLLLRNGSKGHVVVAYDIEDVGPNELYVDIYDSNEQYLTAERIDPSSHTPRELQSRIHITPDGRWQNSVDGWGPGYFHSRDHSFVVTPYRLIPSKPTLPTTWDGLMTVVFGDNARTIQLADTTGHTLFNPDLTPNADPKTRLAQAAPLPAFAGSNSLSDGWAVEGTGPWGQTIRGNKPGDYSVVMWNKNIQVQTTTSINTDAEDNITIEPAAAALTLRTTDTRKVATAKTTTKAKDGAELTITLHTTLRMGASERIAYDSSNGAIAYHHEGPQTTYDVSISRIGGPGLPGAFTTAQINVGAGDTATLRPGNWQDLDDTTAELLVQRNDGSVSQQAVITNMGPPAAIPSITTVVNAASSQPMALAPGEIIAIEGGNIGPAQPVTMKLTANNMMETVLADTRVIIDGIAAPLTYASKDLVRAVVPYEVAGKQSINLHIEYQGRATETVQIPVAAAAPGIFTQDGPGSGAAAAFNQDGTPNGPNQPAPRGSTIRLFATGAGQTSPPGVDGLILADTQHRPVQQIGVRICGLPADVQSAAAALGVAAGTLQVSARIPMNCNPGLVPVVLTVGNLSSQPAVTVAVK